MLTATSGNDITQFIAQSEDTDETSVTILVTGQSDHFSEPPKGPSGKTGRGSILIPSTATTATIARTGWHQLAKVCVKVSSKSDNLLLRYCNHKLAKKTKTFFSSAFKGILW